MRRVMLANVASLQQRQSLRHSPRSQNQLTPPTLRLPRETSIFEVLSVVNAVAGTARAGDECMPAKWTSLESA